MNLRPISLREARRFVGENHRHNRPPVGWLFGVAAEVEGEIVAVGVAGRPVSRMLDNGWNVEITRNTTDGTPNACSMIYGALCRAAKALGYWRAYTYTLASEDGTSLRAAGFEIDEPNAGGGSWSVPSRQRIVANLFGETTTPHEPKVRWIRYLREEARVAA